MPATLPIKTPKAARSAKEPKRLLPVQELLLEIAHAMHATCPVGRRRPPLPRKG